MFKQNLVDVPVRDFVFPVGVVRDGVLELRGTAFFIGGKGIAVTAAHVIDQLGQGGEPIAVFTDGQNWHSVRVLDAEAHPSEDVAIVKVLGEWQSIIEISTSAEHASCEYELWGYPERVAHEARKLATTAREAETLIRTDLIFNRGYVRRRISRELPVSVFRGKAFYELSEVAGSCCSGAPIINRRRAVPGAWPAFGVYIGEETAEAIAAVGYSTRCDALSEWRPKMLAGTFLQDHRATVRS